MEFRYGDESSLDGRFLTCFGQQENYLPSVIVVGGGISGLAAACTLQNASFNVTILEAQDRIGGRIHTDYSFGCPIDMGASWLHGVCDENPLSPIVRRLGLTMYRTSDDDSLLYDHDLESYSLYDLEGTKIPNDMVSEVGDAFKRILVAMDQLRNKQSHDISVREAISIVLDRQPELRLEGWAREVLEWYICRMEAWFAADASMISLKAWDQEKLLTGGHGLMVEGYDPVIKDLSKHLDIRLNHRVKRIVNGPKKVVVTTEDGTDFIADASIITVPLGILKSSTISFEPKLPDWKQSAISDLGVGNENKIALKFNSIFWPNVELLGIVAPTSYTCGYFLNLHKATGHPVLVYMAAGSLANDLEKLSNGSAVTFVMTQLKRMFPEATEPVQYLISRWGSDPNILGCYSYDAVGNSEDIYERLHAPVGNLFFGGEAVSVDHQGSVHGAYSAGILAAEKCQTHILQRIGSLERIAAVACREEVVEGSSTMSPLQISRL